jgi:hypothetical protein
MAEGFALPLALRAMCRYALSLHLATLRFALSQRVAPSALRPMALAALALSPCGAKRHVQKRDRPRAQRG